MVLHKNDMPLLIIIVLYWFTVYTRYILGDKLLSVLGEIVKYVFSDNPSRQNNCQ